MADDASHAKASRLGDVFRTPTADLGVPSVDLDRALQVAGEMEDGEIVRRLSPLGSTPVNPG